MAIDQSELEQHLSDNFPDAVIEVIDLIGDNNHYQVTVKSQDFENMNRMARHRKVMAVLKEKLSTNLHAVSIKTEAL